MKRFEHKKAEFLYGELRFCFDEQSLTVRVGLGFKGLRVFFFV